MDKKIVQVCRKCSDSRRDDFQKTNYIETLKDIQKELSSQNMKNRRAHLAKIPIQSISSYVNKELDNMIFYKNKFNSAQSIGTEHMWIQIGDVNFEKETICGVLCEDAVLFNLKSGSVIINDFRCIEAIEVIDNI